MFLFVYRHGRDEASSCSQGLDVLTPSRDPLQIPGCNLTTDVNSRDCSASDLTKMLEEEETNIASPTTKTENTVHSNIESWQCNIKEKFLTINREGLSAVLNDTNGRLDTFFQSLCLTWSTDCEALVVDLMKALTATTSHRKASITSVKK
jgi:hypothetical protein